MIDDRRTAAETTWTARLAAVLALVAVAGLGFAIADEILEPAPYLNDAVLHTSLARGAAAAIERGADPTDFWLEEIALGFPAFHHYQHLPHVTMAWIARLTGASVERVFAWCTWLLILLLPLSIGWTTRRLTRDAVAGWLAVLVACVASTAAGYGLDLTSFGWAGSGLTTQLWGAVLLGPVWVALRRALRKGRGVAWAGALTGTLVLTHTVLGWVAALTAVAFVPALSWRTVRQRVFRLTLTGAVAMSVALYFVVSFWIDREAMNRSVHEHAWKYDAFGAADTLSKLVRGELFDWDNAAAIAGEPGVRVVPLVTILLGIGVVVAILGWVRRRHVPALLVLFGVWLALSFGRVTWGRLLVVLPLSEDLHFHRLIAPVHLAGFGLAAVGLSAVWRWCVRRWPTAVAAPVIVAGTGIVFAVPVIERTERLKPFTAPERRAGYLDKRALWSRNTKARFEADAGALDRALDRVRKEPAGRVYAGLPTNWGDHYRIGTTPVYARLTTAGLPNVGYLYHAMSLSADVMVYFDERRPAHYNLFNVRYVVAVTDGRMLERGDHMLAADPTFRRFARPIAQEGPHAVFRVPTSGYFDLVEAPITLAGDRAAWYPAMQAWIRSDWVEAKRHPVLFVDRPVAEGHAKPAPLAGLAGRLEAEPPSPRLLGGVIGETVTAGRFEARVNVLAPCYLMLKQTYHPGWHVTVDGRPVIPVMVAPAFAAVPVTPGAQRVVFSYRAPGSRRFLLIAGVFIACVCVMGERWWRARRRREVEEKAE